MLKTDTLPELFARLDADAILKLEDYEFRPNGTFDFIREDFAGRTVEDATQVAGDGFLNYFVRPRVSSINILDMLSAKRCVCLNPKPAGRSFCAFCYRALSPEMQRSLYKRFRQGYEQAYLAALIAHTDGGRTDIGRILAVARGAK